MIFDTGEKRINWMSSVWFWNVTIALLILLGTRSSVFTLLALGLGAVGIVAFDTGKILCIMFFALPFSTIFKLSAGTSFFTYWELLFTIMYFVKKNFRCTRREIGIFLFTLFLAANQCLHGTLDVTMTLKFFSYLIILTAIVNYSFEDENKTVFLCYITGYIMSSFSMLLDGVLFNVRPYVNVKLERVNGEYITRFAGLYGDPNYYVVNIIISMVLLVILFGKKQIRFVHAAILMIPLVVFTAMTGSKSGLLMLAPVAAFFIYQCFVRRHYFFGVLSTILAGVAAVMIFSGEIELFSKVLARLFNGSGGLTSGRAESKWNLYLNYFGENPIRLIFGKSIAFFDLDGAVAHNTYIDLLYELGVVGTVWLLMIIGRVHFPAVKIDRNLLNYSLILVIAVMYFFLSELQYFDPTFHIALAILVFNMDMRGSTCREMKNKCRCMAGDNVAVLTFHSRRGGFLK